MMANTLHEIVDRRTAHRAGRCIIGGVFGALWLTSPLTGFAVTPSSAAAAEFVTESFRVSAADAGVAQSIALRAEELRRSAATEWLGRELDPWAEQCRVVVDARSSRLSGDTTYVLTRGDVRHWRMELRGDPQRILDILLPHEVVHTVLASYFRRPIPRWADEGAALSAEDHHERNRLWKLEAPRLAAGDHVPLHALFNAAEYPAGRDALRRFYVQGGSLTEFLLFAGKPEFIAFVATGVDHGWETAVQRHYGFDSIASLEVAWTEWIALDRPPIAIQPEQLLMAALSAWQVELEPQAPSTSSAGSRQVARDAAIAAPAGGAQ